MTSTQPIKTSPDFPSVSVIDLSVPFGAFRGSLIRHWNAATNNDEGLVDGVWYEFVLRCAEATYCLPVDRVTAARLLIADRRDAQRVAS